MERDGWRFDIGGHRFFTKVKRVDDFWHEILDDDDFMLRPRSSRIYYQGKFYDYPIKLGNALRNLGPIEAVRCGLSFLWVRVRPPKDQSTLEGYVVVQLRLAALRALLQGLQQEGVGRARRPSISADWGAQRIKGMTLWSAVWEPLRARLAGARQDKSKQVTSLIEQFQYPKFGPGMMWERCREVVEAAGTKVIMETPVTTIRHDGGRATAVVAEADGVTTEYPADHVISSMPFSQLLQAMDPPAPAEVQAAADDLAFRDFLSVALVVPADKVPWTDNWIYIHAPEVKTMRVQNFGSWSPYMVNEGHNVLGLEYTVEEGDEWWTATDDELIEKGKAELEALGLVDAADVEAGYVVRMPKAYPVYDDGYQANVEVLKDWLAGQRARTCTRSGATACTGTTTRTTRCTRPCSRSRTSSTTPATTSGRSTSKRSTTKRATTPRPRPPAAWWRQGHRPRRPDPAPQAAGPSVERPPAPARATA